jgi:cytochrome c556
MKKLFTVIAVAFAFAAASLPASAGDFDKQIKARQALMQIYAFNLGQLGAMAKGDVAYDADAAKAAAGNLHAAATMKNGAMWPKGSDSSVAGQEKMTRAKAEIWSTYPMIAEKGKAMAEASAQMAAVAGNGADALRGAMGAVGAACKGCHENFRGPKVN